MNYQDLYNQTEQIVSDYRARLSNVWPTPPPLDALKFAVTEAAEVIDAELRTNPSYARNNDKDLDPLDEVADCLMMLVTAMDSDYHRYDIRQGNFSTKVALLNSFCTDAALYASIGISWEVQANSAITVCLQMLGKNAPNRVEQRLKRIEVKLGQIIHPTKKLVSSN